jgi:hypothetical protein
MSQITSNHLTESTIISPSRELENFVQIAEEPLASTAQNHPKDPFVVIRAQKPLKDKQELAELYHNAIKLLDSQHAYFLTHVLNIGRPKWYNGIATAAVGLERSKAEQSLDQKLEFIFIFNPLFASQLSVAEMSFVLCHETMHILLDHLRLGQKFANEMIFNIASDLVINDFLSEAGIEPIEGALRGEKRLGFSCARSTVSSIYQALQALQNDPNLCPHCNKPIQKNSANAKNKKSSNEPGLQDEQVAQETQEITRTDEPQLNRR